MLAKNNITQSTQKVAGFENLAFSFLMARRTEMMRQQTPKKTQQNVPETYLYRAKKINQLICLTSRQHQCLWLYHQHKNIKSVAVNMGISNRTTEEHLKFARKKFQMQKLKLLMDAIDNQLIECVHNT